MRSACSARAVYSSASSFARTSADRLGWVVIASSSPVLGQLFRLLRVLASARGCGGRRPLPGGAVRLRRGFGRSRGCCASWCGCIGGGVVRVPSTGRGRCSAVGGGKIGRASCKGKSVLLGRRRTISEGDVVDA